MAETGTTEANRMDSEDPSWHLNETALRGEIAFWQEMIACACDSLPPEAAERMEQALALAECRLAGLYETHASSQGEPANVYRLDVGKKRELKSDVHQRQANVR